MSARCRPICLPAEDAVELVELLEFLADWIEHTTGHTERALHPFVCRFSGYAPADLLDDLRRFAFLLGGTNPALVYGDEGGDDR